MPSRRSPPMVCRKALIRSHAAFCSCFCCVRGHAQAERGRARLLLLVPPHSPIQRLVEYAAEVGQWACSRWPGTVPYGALEFLQ